MFLWQTYVAGNNKTYIGVRFKVTNVAFKKKISSSNGLLKTYNFAKQFVMAGEWL